jgi:hypothetical protein
MDCGHDKDSAPSSKWSDWHPGAGGERIMKGQTYICRTPEIERDRRFPWTKEQGGRPPPKPFQPKEKPASR